jgi:RNA polymerase sigma-70 factor (ECF subfamily)
MLPAAAPHHSWQSCFDELAPKLLLFARQWVPCTADAEDVVQTAFVRWWRQNPSASKEHYPLLFAAVRSASLDLLRKNTRRVLREEHPDAVSLGSSDSCFDAPLERQEDAAALEAALSQLPQPQREVVVLRIWGELTFAEIGTSLGESMHTVASRYRAGLETLRKLLRNHLYERV